MGTGQTDGIDYRSFPFSVIRLDTVIEGAFGGMDRSVEVLAPDPPVIVMCTHHTTPWYLYAGIRFSYVTLFVAQQ